MALLLPKPPVNFEDGWANHYSAALERENQMMWSAIQQLQLAIVPNYTTAQKLTLMDMRGQLVFDTTLGKLCVNTGSGWETVTSV